MKSAISAGALCLLFGTIAPAYAQQQQHEEKGQQGQQHEQQQHQQAQQQQQQHQQPAQQQHAEQQRQHQPAQQQQHPQQANRPVQRQEKPQSTYGSVYHGGVQPTGPTYGGVHHSGVPQHQGQVRGGFEQSRAKSWDDDHRTWGQRGGYNGYRVPEDRYRRYWGSNHYFRIYRLPMVFVGGYPRFQYDGYWVTFVDPWPGNWAANWYETDDVYIDYSDDGYYLYDRRYPGIPIAVTISF